MSNPDINPRPLIPEEDIYALAAITVCEMFVGENPYGPFVSQDDELGDLGQDRRRTYRSCCQDRMRMHGNMFTSL